MFHPYKTLYPIDLKHNIDWHNICVVMGNLFVKLETAMSAQIESKNKRPVVNRKNLSDAKKYKHIAYQYFEEAQQQVVKIGKNETLLNQALENILLSVECNPNDGDAYNLLARIQLESGDFQPAQQAIKFALEFHPRNGGYYYSAGHIALAQSDLHRAEEFFRKAIKYAPKETRAEVSLAYTLAQSGNMVEAFNQYRELAKTQSQDKHIRSQLLQCANQLQADHYDPELEQDLLHFLSWNEMNLNQLSSLCSSLLECKFQLDKNGSAAQFNEIATCPLLISSLKNTLVKSSLLEKLLMALRHELLSYATKQGQLSNEHIPLCEALGRYGLRTEYILPASLGEVKMISTLRNIIEQSLNQIGCSPMDIAGALSLLVMYESWETLNNIETLRSFKTDSWPKFILSIKSYQDTLHSHSKMSFEKLTDIPEAKDQGVKAQYENYPYPTWSSLEYRNPSHYGHALKNEYPNSNLPKHLFNQSLEVLIAGCGTGRHALNVASSFINLNVLAIDISQRSLAYAKNKAKEFDIDNIKFKLADLTRLGILDRKYNIIECSGVLHHIKEDEKALRNLLKNLLPNGLIKISLYSKRARKNITNMRNIFGSGNQNIKKIRVIRQAIMQSGDNTMREGIINSDDFYSMSGTVDLLFHEYEKCFTPLEIKKLCEDNQLQWLGFSNLNYQVKSDFKELHGANANLQDLDKWEEFEKHYPDTFSVMYQFYCQHKPKLSMK